MEPVIKGKGLLKVAAILMTIIGGLSILIALISIAIFGFLTTIMTRNEDAVLAFGIAVVVLVGLILLAVLELVTGIIGIKNAGKPEHAVRCLVLGIIVLVIAAVCIGILVSSMSFRGDPVLAIVVYTLCAAAVVVPILYVIGAAKNRSSYKAMTGSSQ
ncbi:MAG: hypothetical protein J5483_04645 [Lachnospiraceae bacterium]|nr:hypothetical protein [Lachnospiraceae bacterium]